MAAFRNSASFGKRIEYYIISKMLKEGLDVYTPVVDDHGVDVVVKNPQGVFCEVQVKAVSGKNKGSQSPVFAAIDHPLTPIPNYWFVFYSEATDSMWLLSSSEFINECSRNVKGKSTGKCSISLGPGRNKYLATDFRRI